ncbi:hypothetical protein [Teredinibacter purpureus]|uniref:hypothetical protein n=1 Tax=Teredinibacter purpureus TaxID=2731756 RepID=UPI0005F89378|nr:hypothetical protein [Teredinibacter purpureus]
MKTFAALIALALVSNGVIAGEVGALDPRTSKAALSVNVALAEIGTSDRWESLLDNYVVQENVSSRQLKKLYAHIDSINTTMNSELSILVEKTVKASLQY